MQTPGQSSQQAASTWTILSAQVEAFIEAWESAAQPPNLREFLARDEPAAHRLTLIELVKVDLEYRWRRKTPRLLEDYFGEFPELAERPPPDLVYEEYHIRAAAGDAVAMEEYARRFPGCARELARLLGLHAANVSTAMIGPRSALALAEVQPGEQLDDFDLLTQLGKGAFASVFLARQKSMQRLVALKVSADRSQEPQTLAQFDHEHIVRVYDQRLLPDRGLRLLYMQYVAGGTLQAVVESVRRTPESERTGQALFEAVDDSLVQRGESRPSDAPLRERFAEAPWAEVVCWLGARLARALDYAHRHGVLHRDIKPANVLVSADGSPKLADFNISFSSKLAGASPAAYFGGSLAYMSPEQLEAGNPAHERLPESLDGRSDLYSLGVLLWELLTGTRPFPDIEAIGNWPELLSEMVTRRQAGIDRASLAQASRRWPPGLERILAKCLDSDRERRFASGAELARSLELCLKPAAQRLLAPPARNWRRVARRFPTVGIVVAAILPNALAAVFNYFYNSLEIVEHLDRARDVFWTTQIVINSIAFPLGLGLALALSRPVTRAVGDAPRIATMTAIELQKLRQRCLRLGHFAAWISIALWLAAAPAYPMAIRLGVGSVPASAYLHFVASLALCGLIAGAYPFLGISCLSVCSFYPALVRMETMTREDFQALGRLGRASWLYLLLAASVPMLSVAILSLVGSKAHFALAILASGGVAGLATAFLLFRMLHADLAALAALAAPPGDPAESGTDSFRIGSR
ncbi:MAG TPA: serine/threonine-protein kinase [Planctomycetaceae bacterium]|nr:serine/threonine-protein kinase [Planctomycetaceae bacterium]